MHSYANSKTFYTTIRTLVSFFFPFISFSFISLYLFQRVFRVMSARPQSEDAFFQIEDLIEDWSRMTPANNLILQVYESLSLACRSYSPHQCLQGGEVSHVHTSQIAAATRCCPLLSNKIKLLILALLGCDTMPSARTCLSSCPASRCKPHSSASCVLLLPAHQYLRGSGMFWLQSRLCSAKPRWVCKSKTLFVPV